MENEVLMSILTAITSALGIKEIWLVWKKRIEIRGDSYVDVDHLSRLKYRYHKFLEHTNLKNIRTILSGSQEMDDFIQREILNG